jgi:hypothetical protein
MSFVIFFVRVSMLRNLYLFLIYLVCFFLFSALANAYDDLGSGVLCVNDTADLSEDFRLALIEVERLDADDNTFAEVRLKGLKGLTGGTTYSIPDDTHFNVITAHSLEISGGWDTDCSTQTTGTPDLTILEGGATQAEPGGVLSVTIKDNSSATVKIHNLTINNGSSEKSGGGLYFFHTASSVTAATVTLSLYDIIMENNETNTFGSGIEILDDGTSGGMLVDIYDCIIRSNSVTSASGGPGGISVEVPFTVVNGSKLVDTYISNCQILDNSAAQMGGGIYINSAKGDRILVNNVIAGNSVSDDNGGGVYIINSENGNITLTNNTITNNETTGTTLGSQGGGGIYVDLDNALSSLNIYNNIIFKNAAAGDGDDILIVSPNPNDITINNNDFNDTLTTGFLIEGDDTNLITEKNINVDPDFEDSTNDNYHLLESSQAIDAGDNSAPFIPAKDLDGVTRPQNAIVDMGAYEYASTTTTSATTTTTTTLLPGLPIVITESASNISTSAATLNGTVDPNNGSTNYFFEYGLTISYGSETDEFFDLTGSGPIDVSQDIEDLTLNTTYNYRLVASNADGTSTGANRSFTTPEKNTPKAGGEGCFIATAINGN